RVVDARAFAGGLNSERYILEQNVAPCEPASALVELREMENSKRADARDDTARATNIEIGTPDIGPPALNGHAARNGPRSLEALLPRLCTKSGLQARRGHK